MLTFYNEKYSNYLYLKNFTATEYDGVFPKQKYKQLTQLSSDHKELIRNKNWKKILEIKNNWTKLTFYI